MSQGEPLEILIVEDDDDVCTVLTRILRRRGHRIVRCNELEAASTLLTVRCFDLALIDLTLPDGTGVDAAQVARSRVPKPYLVALTGWTRGPLHDAAEATFDDVVHKPMKGTALDAILEAARRAGEVPAA